MVALEVELQEGEVDDGTGEVEAEEDGGDWYVDRNGGKPADCRCRGGIGGLGEKSVSTVVLDGKSPDHLRLEGEHLASTLYVVRT